MRYTMAQLDNMEGHHFEYAVADLLFHNGWRDVEVTQGSGDYGVDVLARRKNVRYGIQCKRHKGNVVVKAVQEALSGTEFYHCDMAAVITNSIYTKQAITLAQISGVRLFDRDFLIELIENYDEEYDILDPKSAMSYTLNYNTVSATENTNDKCLNQISKKIVPKNKKDEQGTIMTYLSVVVISGFAFYILIQIIHFLSSFF